MPSYRVHSVVGLLAAGLAVVVGSIFFLASVPALAALFLAISFSAVLADVDSDTSTPFHVASTVGSLLIAGAGSALVFGHSGNLTPWQSAAVPLGLLILAKVVVFGIVKRLTDHRGAWHSIPAALICGLLGLYVANRAGLDPGIVTAVGGGLLLGYLLHLVLDEGSSLFRFRFIFFWRPAPSLGTALKWRGRGPVATTVMWAAVAILLVLNFSFLRGLVLRVG